MWQSLAPESVEGTRPGLQRLDTVLNVASESPRPSWQCLPPRFTLHSCLCNNTRGLSRQQTAGITGQVGKAGPVMSAQAAVLGTLLSSSERTAQGVFLAIVGCAVGHTGSPGTWEAQGRELQVQE